MTLQNALSLSAKSVFKAKSAQEWTLQPLQAAAVA